MLTILMLLVAPSSSLEAPLKIDALDADRFMLTLETEPSTSFQAAQAALLPAAKRACQSNEFFLGAFKFSDRRKRAPAEPEIGGNSFNQEVFCTSQEDHTRKDAMAIQQFSEAQQRAVLAATYSYFAAKDSNRFSTAYEMLSRRAKLMKPAVNWTQEARAFYERVGAVRARRVTELSWYRDPPEASEPGVYVAADFSGTFVNTEVVCGYLVWRLNADGNLRLTREEQNFLERRPGGRIAELDQASLRAQMGCKD